MTETYGLSPEHFKRLPKDGAQFEALVCQLLEAMGYRVLERPAVGTEGGRDVLVERTLKDAMSERSERVLVQCKHHAQSGKSVGDDHVGVWQNAMARYKARGYLLVTDVRVTENLSRSFREFTEDDANYPKWAEFWDVDRLILYLNGHPDVRDSFLPPVTVAPRPLHDLVSEVQAWLRSIRYNLTEPNSLNDRSVDMTATFDAGSLTQSVLVRCVGGEILVSDVRAVDDKLDRRIPQGWIICDKRVSKRAREHADKTDGCRIFTLPEFLTEMVWGPYFESLTSLALSSRISELYVDLSCHKQEVGESGELLNREEHASLDRYIDAWLSERGKMHISLLGEFGTGKTWFCRHYAYRQLNRYLADPANERLPLLITLRTFAKSTNARQLINDALLEQYKLPFVGSAFDVFQEMNRRGKLLLLLDGFDEMARQVDRQVIVDNFWELAGLVTEASKVILTSRTVYFSWAKESEEILGGKIVGSKRKALSPPQFEIVHLNEFTDDQVREVIRRRVGGEEGNTVANRILSSYNLAEMVRKPVLIELLLAALEETSADLLQNPSHVYLYATDKLLMRNISAEKTFTSTADKLFFVCQLAWEMISDEELRIHYKDIPERIRAYFGKRIKDQHELDAWNYDLRSQTFLHRDAAGYYEFSHKSLAEYFSAFKLAAECGCLAKEFREAYREADGRPCSLQDIEVMADPKSVHIPTVNMEVATFFAEMAADILQESLPSASGKSRMAAHFRDVKKRLSNRLNVRIANDALTAMNRAVESLRNEYSAQSVYMSVVFANEIVHAQTSPSDLPRFRIATGRGLVGWAVQNRKTAAVNLSPSPIESFYKPLAETKNIVAEVVIPILRSEHEKPMGVLTMDFSEKRDFEQAEVKSMEELCHIVGMYLSLAGRFRECWRQTPVGAHYLLTTSLMRGIPKDSELDFTHRSRRVTT